MLIRPGRIATFAVTVAVLLTAGVVSPAAAGYRRVRDVPDVEGRLDVRWAAHGHADDDRLRHGIGTYGRWRDRALRSYRIRVDFNLDGDRAAERQLRVRYGKGRLRAAMFEGELFDSRVPGRVAVRRPNRRSLWVSFAPGMLKEDLERYRWRVLAYARGVCPGSCPADAAPGRGWIRHRL